MKFLIAHEDIYSLCRKPNLHSNIFLVKNAQETEKALKVRHYDVLICHLHLPGSGPDAAAWISSLKTKGILVPVTQRIISGPSGESPSYAEIYEIFLQNLTDPSKVYKKLYGLMEPYCKETLIQRLQEAILTPFLPLHISLQAFFGISRDEEDSWVKLNEVRDLPEEWEETFPNKNAFLLVPKAQWDFYATIFDRLYNEKEKSWAKGSRLLPDIGNEEEKEEYEKPPIIRQIDELFKVLGARGNRKQMEDFMKDDTLLRLCALLANTCDYKGKYPVKRDKILEQLVQGGLPRHSKWPNENGDPTDAYEILREQLNCFFGEEKGKEIVGKIDRFADHPQVVVESVEGE